MAERPIVLLVLGMHRSGTSALTRVLNLLGAALPGDLLGGNRSNPQGHWESRRVIAIDEALLAALDRRWDDPRPLPAGWLDSPAAASARAQIAAFAAEELATAPLAIIKDPRLCLLAPLWLEVLAAQGLDVRVLVPLRDPQAVAASLQRRDGMATASAVHLWRRHLIGAEAASRGLRRAPVHFVDLLADWRGTVARIAAALDLTWPIADAVAAPAIAAFLDARPRAPDTDLPALPDDAAALAATLAQADADACWQAIAALPPPVEDAPALLATAIADIGARELHAAAALARAEVAAAARQAAMAQAEQLRQLVGEQSNAIAALRAKLACGEQQRAALAETHAAALAQRQAQLATQTAALAEERKRVAALLRKLAEFDRAVAGKTGEVERLARTLAQVEQERQLMLHSRSWKLTAPLRRFNARRQARAANAAGEPRAPAFAAAADGGAGEPFDAAFYLSEYPDVRAAGLDPQRHYLDHGRAEGRLPRRPPPLALDAAPAFDAGKATVLLVGHDASRTGAPVLSLNLIAGLRRRFNVICMPLRGGGLLAAFRHHATVTLDPHAYGERAAPMVAALDALAPAQRPAWAIVNSIEARAVLPLLAARGIATVCLIHEFPAYTRPRVAFPEAIWWATQTVFSTELTRDAAIAAFPELADAPLRVLPQGRCTLTAEPLADDDRHAEAAWLTGRLRPDGEPDDTVLVVGIGSVQQRKGVDLFVQCAAQALALAGGRNCRFAWIGHGYDPEHDLGYSVYLEDQLRRSGLDGRMVFVGPTAHIDAIYGLADVLLLSSRLDPLPNVAIDAMAHGLPVLCFAQATGIAAELGAAGVGGECVSPYLDTADMAAKLAALAAAPQRRRVLGEQLRRYVAERFDMDAYVAGIAELGELARAQQAREAQAVQAIVAGDGLRVDFFRREPLRGQALAEIVRCEYVRPWAAGVARRKPLPGLHPGVYAECAGLTEGDGDPFAHWLQVGRPDGPWRLPVIAATATAAPVDARVRVALHIHVYYPDLLPTIVQRLRGNRLRPDLYVSIARDEDEPAVRQALQACPGKLAQVLRVPNRGRDIGPLLTAFAEPLSRRYDLIGHIHTKKSADLADPTVGERWCEFLLENLLGGRARMADAVIAAMAADASLGLVFPDDPNVVGWGANRPCAQQLAARLQLGELPRQFNFPVGTMFWARAAALRPLFDLRLDWQDYPPEPLPYDGSMLHAIERLLPLVAARAGLRCAVTWVPGVTR
ncbi:MAG: glycosyltransferase [Proteobacteria bacterium]|nr:glycosyltransferase [Pseudomonadota bacterium]